MVGSSIIGKVALMDIVSHWRWAVSRAIDLGKLQDSWSPKGSFKAF